jgi:CheY-like chemotaxis protein
MAHDAIDKRVRVLIIEDDDSTRRMYARHLDLQGGYRVAAAASLAEALEALELMTYHVALVDIMLAGPKDTANRDGTAVLDRISELDEGTRAVVLSAQEEPQEVREFMKEHGAFDYLEKKDLLKTGISKLFEYIEAAAAESTVSADPSWDAVVGSLAGERNEVEFVSEVMGKLKFGGGFENLQRTLIAATRHLAPLALPCDDGRGLCFSEDDGAMVAHFWSKGQGCSIEVILAGKGSDLAPAKGDGVLVNREKGGLSVRVERRGTEPRDAFAELAR